MTVASAAESGRLLIAGLGYSGSAVARAAAAAGWQVAGTARDPARTAPPPGVACLAFAEAGPAIRAATHLLVTAAPGEGGDPVLAAHAAAIRAAPALRWIGYLSTTGVYGDRGGAWVEETTEPAPGQERSRRRLAAEQAWRAAAAGRALDLFRAGGIYGPGRSVLDELRAGTARRIVKPGHAFGRIHRDDIALAVLVALRQAPPPGVRVLHLVDDAPAESAEVMAGAAALLGLEPPPAIPFEAAAGIMSPMARSFWAENRKVANAATKRALGIAWRYPSWREGLEAILAEERGEGPA
ncbi:SDR family NAD(P)-dependent oxidoreductase [Siccirubricoccus sp. KC 17139]|uniref:SDR family NAD(P)-dependent oxidoreductase n=1 Tax=Siccirubricoccus soli TaxID=2899147 RepID=A0ABT1D4S4_9PROT|nr:SDR family NAD(P)-dependent oxidoreductase [Siccirubricoccus soli]MCO6416919.1 SDR family NAD(P)-dependent oxidoreductase [Siccirubricoccus soli]MCP2683054.1 SDR family NAD(P)-dependent oxidoreductase [Siccirubricoccus soli]